MFPIWRTFSHSCLQAGTSVAADLLGWEKRVGRLVPGLLADLVVVDENPLKDIAALQRVKAVMLNGVLVRNDYDEAFVKPESTLWANEK